MSTPPTVLCLASYHKGFEFLREAKRQGCRVFLVTSESLRDAEWPAESLDDIFYVPDVDKRWQLSDLLLGASHLARTMSIDLVVPLDDFDLEKAASLREHLRLPGMGETTTRYFRDKLAMRMQASEARINVPPFVHVLNDGRIANFCRTVPPPWILKPRDQAGAVGVTKVDSEAALWPLLDALGDRRSFYLLERFIAGDVYHVDSLVVERIVPFAVSSQYGRPPLEVSHGGGVFTTQLVERGSAIDRALLDMNARVLGAFGLVRGASHSEFIRSPEGTFYFLETSARVGGAHIADLVEAATGVNLWAEWAKIEVTTHPRQHRVDASRADYAALLVSLAREERPDLSAFADPEVVWRLDRPHHAGLIVRSPDRERVTALVQDYATRFARDVSASLPATSTPHS